jgi:hypothetical protein
VNVRAFFENQPPLVRANLKLGLAVLALIPLLHAGIWAGVRVLPFNLFTPLDEGLRLLQTLLFLLVTLLAYNALKSIWFFVRGHRAFSVTSLILSIGAMFGVALAGLNVPHLVPYAIAHQAGRPYRVVYAEFSALCRAWEAEFAESESASLLPDGTSDIGRLGQEAQFYRERSTLIFNFAPEGASNDFGLACALRGQPPATSARANRYDYQHLEGVQYRFLERNP